MARSQAPFTALLCAALLAAALSPAAAQLLAVGMPPGAVISPATAPAPIDDTNIATTSVGSIGSGATTVPVAAMGPNAATTAGIGGEISPNRTVGTQLVVPPSGCLVVSITAAEGMCLQDASFQVNSQSIAIPADYQQAGIPGSNLFFSRSSYRANNSACAASSPTVTQVYETDGCVLADAAAATVGAGTATDVRNSFVCSSSGTDTTNYARAFGATTAEQRFCTVAARDAANSVSMGNGTASSGDPCTAPRATYIITNPCPDFNTTVNTTARFFLADFAMAPAPAPEMELAPATAPATEPATADSPSGAAMTPDSAPGAAPGTEPGFAPAPAPGSATAGAMDPSAAPAPAPQSASRAAASGTAAAAVAAVAFAMLS